MSPRHPLSLPALLPIASLLALPVRHFLHVFLVHRIFSTGLGVPTWAGPDAHTWAGRRIESLAVTPVKKPRCRSCSLLVLYTAASYGILSTITSAATYGLLASIARETARCSHWWVITAVQIPKKLLGWAELSPPSPCLKIYPSCHGSPARSPEHVDISSLPLPIFLLLFFIPCSILLFALARNLLNILPSPIGYSDWIGFSLDPACCSLKHPRFDWMTGFCFVVLEAKQEEAIITCTSVTPCIRYHQSHTETLRTALASTYN